MSHINIGSDRLDEDDEMTRRTRPQPRPEIHLPTCQSHLALLCFSIHRDITQPCILMNHFSNSAHPGLAPMSKFFPFPQGWAQPIICLHLTRSSSSSLTQTDLMSSLVPSINLLFGLPLDLPVLSILLLISQLSRPPQCATHSSVFSPLLSATVSTLHATGVTGV